MILIPIALGLTFAVMGLVQAIAGYRISGLPIIVIYLAIYTVLDRVRRGRRDAARGAEPDPDYSGWPTSGPIGRFGQRGLLVPWTLTSLLTILNPFQAMQVFRQIAGNARLQRRERRAGNDGSGYENKARYTLPFAGEWFVYNGGTTAKTSHSWDVLGQRYALDFVQADENLVRHLGRGTRPEQYRCYGAEILAAADGTVIAVENRVRTAPLLGWGICDITARSFIGNYVLIRHAADEFALYAHLIRDSVAAAPGQTVRRRQTIGKCGHTGHSTEPHLHFHLQDSDDIFSGMGLPIRFHGFLLDGNPKESGFLTAGNRVCNVARGDRTNGATALAP